MLSPQFSRLPCLELEVIESCTPGQMFLVCAHVLPLGKELKQGNWGCSSEMERSPRVVRAPGSIPMPIGKPGFFGTEVKGSGFLGFSHTGSAGQAWEEVRVTGVLTGKPAGG